MRNTTFLNRLHVRNSVRIIEVSDNRGTDNRGRTVQCYLSCPLPCFSEYLAIRTGLGYGAAGETPKLSTTAIVNAHLHAHVHTKDDMWIEMACFKKEKRKKKKKKRKKHVVCWFFHSLSVLGHQFTPSSTPTPPPPPRTPHHINKRYISCQRGQQQYPLTYDAFMPTYTIEC